MSRHGEGVGPLNKEFLESNDFTSLEQPPEPKETPNPCSHHDIFHNGHYANDVRKKTLKKKQQNISPAEQRHVFQQRSTSTSSTTSLNDKSSDHGEEIKFNKAFDENGDEAGYLASQPPPPPIRRNSSLFEDFKKDYYQNLHMFDEPK